MTYCRTIVAYHYPSVLCKYFSLTHQKRENQRWGDPSKLSSKHENEKRCGLHSTLILVFLLVGNFDTLIRTHQKINKINSTPLRISVNFINFYLLGFTVSVYLFPESLVSDPHHHLHHHHRTALHLSLSLSQTL